jgi:hypothetical protein
VQVKHHPEFRHFSAAESILTHEGFASSMPTKCITATINAESQPPHGHGHLRARNAAQRKALARFVAATLRECGHLTQQLSQTSQVWLILYLHQHLQMKYRTDLSILKPTVLPLG